MGKTLDTGRLTNAISTNGNNNVGIGTTSPNSKLQVNGTDLTSFTSASYAPLFLQGGTYTGSQVQAIDFGSSSYTKPLVRIGARIGSAGSSLQFGTSNAYTTGITNTAMTINESGNVGIGTTNPYVKLNVNGISQFGSPTLQTSGGEYIVLGQNSSTGPDDGNCLGLYVLHAAASASPQVKLTYQFRQNDNSGANLYGDVIRATKESGSNSTFTSFFTNSTIGVGTEKMRIFSTGNVGIGTSSDNGNKFQINGYQSMLPYSGGGSSYGVRFSNNNGAYWEIRNVDLYNKFQFIYQGSVLADINSSNGVYTALSDERKKKDFEISNIGLSAILALEPTLYRMKTDDESEPKQLGFIAQQVQSIMPEACSQIGEYLGVQDRPIVAALVKAVQELKAENDTLKTRIENLENK